MSLTAKVRFLSNFSNCSTLQSCWRVGCLP